MSTLLAIGIGIVLGAIGGALHLAVVRFRAGLATTHGAGAALLAMPLGLVGPAAAVLAAALVAPASAWATPLGIFAVRLFVLRRARR